MFPLMAAFLRIPEPGEEINIDVVRTSTLTIRALRTSVAVNPQRPFFFLNDTLRRNLELWEQHSDAYISALLERV